MRFNQFNPTKAKAATAKIQELEESGDGEYINFTVWCTDGRYDENYFIKARSRKDAHQLVRGDCDGQVKNVTVMDDEYMNEFDINPEEHEVNVPYLYDSGT